MKNETPKVIVIGLDGADWHLLGPWIGNGDLPTLARLMSEGARGDLRSTIRPESSVAWSTFSTGVNPGKHGVFGFAKRSKTDYGYRLANASSVRVRRFWDILGDQGVRVGIINVPFTYPPSEVNGFLVSGMLTPGTDRSFTYPEQLRPRLLRRFDTYRFDVGHSTQDKVQLVDAVRALTDQQRETALFLMQSQAWDFLVVVFTGPDRLQHFLWADLEPQHPRHDPESARRWRRALLEHYQGLDSTIAAILENTASNTLLMIMSDHGFNGCARTFYINHWLQEQGLLSLKHTRDWRSDASEWLARLGSIHWLRRIKRAILPNRWSSVDLQSVVFTQAVNWSDTKAFFGLDGGLTINLQGREPEGIVEPGEAYESLRQRLRGELLTVIDPKTNAPPLADVFFREELYQGRFVAEAPDLILEPQRDNPNPAHNFVLNGSFKRERVGSFGSSAPYAANHALDGILVAWGSGIARGGRLVGARIVDLAPTILAAMGVVTPDYMDGRLLSEMFAPDRVPIFHRTSTLEPEALDDSVRQYTRAEEREIEARLRDLGYLD